MQPERTDNVIPMNSETPPPSDGEGAAGAPTGGQGGKARKPRAKRSGEINLGNYTRLMEAFALIYGTKTAWDESTRRIVPIDALRLAFTNDSVKAWLGSPNRRMVMPEQLVFEPGQDVEADGRINMFAGLEVEPLACADAEVQPMVDLLRHLCSGPGCDGDEVDEVMHWVLCWQALPLQKIGTKMQTAVVMHGPQGTGKNLYWDTWRDMFGTYGITVGQTEIEDKDNSWVSCKLAIVGDEVVSRQEMYHNKNRLKLVVTQATKFAIRALYQSTRWESNHANVVFLSNESQPLALEERDRRYMVTYTPLEADQALYDRVRTFLANQGLRKWLYYLQRYPIGDFHAHTKPRMTEAKRQLITAGYKPAQRFADEWLNGFLPLPVQVCSSEQLYRCFKSWANACGERFLPSAEIFGRDLARFANEKVQLGESPRIAVKVFNLESEKSARKSVRCWIPKDGGPPQEFTGTQGQWATESVAMFERHIAAYLRTLNPMSGSDGVDE